MASHFQEHGRDLLGNGYLIIPIRPGHKRPALDNWQTARLGASDLQRYPQHGVGILTGQGAHPVAAIDVDTTDVVLAQRFVTWCQENLGATVERVGNAPKVLLVYRAQSEGWGKATGAWFEDEIGARHRLEILGKGQQFVAYHIHPDTNMPYEWVDLFGGLAAMRADDLPTITEAQVEDALQVFEAMAAEAGLLRVQGSRARVGSVTSAPEDDPLMAYEPPVGIDLGEAKRMLAYVDNEDYDTWVKVGMSLHHEFEGGVEALDLWDEWSSTASNYSNRGDLEKRWDSFGRTGRNPTTARWLLKVGHQGKRDAVKVEKRTALDEAKALIAACTDSIDLVNEVARQAGEAAGMDLALRAELAGLIRAKFKELTDTTLPVADVRAAMAGGRKGVTFTRQRRQMTEFGNAERMLDHYGVGLMFVPELDAWFAWTGVYWRRCAGVELEHLAKETIRALPDEAKNIESDGERAEFFKFCAVSQRAVMVRNMVSLAQSDPRVVVPVSELDRDAWLLGVANGAVDLRSGRLVPPSQDHRLTTVTSTEYDPSAQAPLFNQTVTDVFFGDQDMIGFFQRLVGYSILAQPTEDILVIPYGSGSNGKSTVLGAIREALGEHARMAASDTFLSSGQNGGNAGAAREDVLRLRGARFVYVSEPDEGSELREGLIKSMTGGEPLPARGLYSKTTVEVVPTWVAFMPTNHRPIVKGDDHAIWRRLMLVPFTRNFDQDLTLVKDPDRADKLAAERKGILRWCVEGALAYQRDGLKAPGRVGAARDEYKQDMDLLAEWLDECCEVGPEFSDTSARLWASWEGFAKARGELQFIRSARALGRRLSARFSARKGPGGLRETVGVRVRFVGDF
jgi:putative DNA primase/helicase